MLDWTEYTKLFAGLLAIVNPLGIVPIFLSLTEGNSVAQRRRVAVVSSVAVAIILITCLVLGNSILQIFGITIGSFRVAGGLLLMIVAISMLYAAPSPIKTTGVEQTEAVEKEDIAIVPLAIPLMAGPGAISTVIVFAQQSTSLYHYLMVSAVTVSVAVVTVVILMSAPVIGSLFGKTGMNIVTRVMGLILAAIAVEFIASGMLSLFPGLG
jgi:multiple antibiotic resistance protein